MDQATRSRAESMYKHLSSKGLRVLAVAFRRVDDRESYSKTEERELTLAGYISFLDPPVEDAAEVIGALKRDGVAVKILTGDSDLVAQYICGKVGLDGTRVIAGEQIEHLSDPALQHIAETHSVFARISPSQKTRILLALRHRGQ